MSLPYGLTIDRLTELFSDLNKCIKLSFEDFDEYEFIKTFIVKDDFIFNFRRFYHMDELVLTAYLKHGIEMEYNDIIKDSKGNELSFEQCQKLVRWFLGETSSNSDEVWIPMKTINPSLDINNSIYTLFKKYIRENICSELNVKAKFEKKEENIIKIGSENVEETTYIYYAFIGLQASRGLPIGFSTFKLRDQARHKYQDYIINYNRETEKLKAFKRKIDRSSKICTSFLCKVAKKYHKSSKSDDFSKLCGNLVDQIIKFGFKFPTKEASKFSEKIYDKVKTILENV